MDLIYQKVFFSDAQYSKISELFELGALSKSRHLDSHGFESSKTVLETDKGKFIVSAYLITNNKTGKTKTSIQYEIDLLQLLDDLPVPKYVKSINGAFIEETDNYNVTVYSFIEGTMPKDLTPEIVFQLGEFLGKFHVKGKQFRKSLPGRRKFYHFNKKILREMDKFAYQQTNPLLVNSIDEVRQGLERNILPRNLQKGPIHVDVKPENELFIREKLSGILDFGIFYIDSLLIDIGKTIMWNCVKNSQLEEKLVTEFLRGYEKERKLTSEEKLLVNQAILFGIYAHLYVDFYHVPLKRVPESYTLGLVEDFLPVARQLEK